MIVNRAITAERDHSKLELSLCREQYSMEDTYEKMAGGVLCKFTRFSVDCGRDHNTALGIFREYISDTLEMEGIKYSERPVR